jgi:hypothetical protein
MRKNLQNFAMLLDQMGFSQTTQGAEILWKSQSGSPSQAVRSKVEILERKDRFILDKFNVGFDLNKVVHALEITARKKFQKVVSCSTRINSKSSIQIILEIAPSLENGQAEQRALQNHPGTILGWTTSITFNQSSLILQITDAFFIGQPAPDWWAQISKIITETLTPGLSSLWCANNLFEIALPIYAIAVKTDIDLLGLKESIQTQHVNPLKIPRPISLELQPSKVTIQLASPETIFEPDYPIEIHEARETSEIWFQIDQSIFNKQTPVLPKPILSQQPACIMARVGAHPPLTAQLPTNRIGASTLGENSSLIAISGEVLHLAHRGRSHDMVKLVSTMLRRIAGIYGELNHLAPMRNILPEILGDIWSTVDASRSLLSWQIALDQKPKNLRVLHKIAKLAKESGQSDKEFEALVSICQLERRASALKTSTSRLIDLSKKYTYDDLETKTKLRTILEVAARKTEFDEKIVMSLCKILRKSGEHKKALSILESCIKSNLQKISQAQLADLHAEIAAIWEIHENNAPLATARYIAATTTPSEPSDSLLDEAEAFFTRTANADQLKRLFLLRANQTGRQAPTEAMERAAKYMNKINHHDEAVAAVIELMKMNRYQQWYCDIILDAYNISQINWTEVAQLMQKADPKQLPKDTLPMWKLITGRCALKNEESWMIAVGSFLDKLVVRLMSEDESRRLLQILIKRKQLKELSTFISNRLPSAKDSEVDTLLKTVIAENLIAEDGIFEQAIAQKANTTSSVEMSLQRLSKFIIQTDTKNIFNLIQAHMDAITNNDLLIALIDQGIKILCDSENAKLTETLSFLLKIRDEKATFQPFEREVLIDNLIRKKFPSIAEDLIKSSIEAGELGISKQDMVHGLLSNSPDTLARWHYIQMTSEQNPKARHENAQHCLRFWLLTENRPKQLVEAISVLAQSEVLEFATLTLLESICKREKKPEEFLAVLGSQLEKNSTYHSDLLYWSIRTIHSQNLDREASARLYEKNSARLMEHAIHKLYSQAQLWLSARNLGEAQRCFIALLKDPDVLTEGELCFTALDGLAQTRPQRSQFATMVQSLISWAETSPDRTIAQQLIDKSIDLEIASLEHLHAKITQKFDNLSPKQLATIAIQALAKSERSSNGIIKLLDEWRATKAIAEQPEKWREVIACLTSDHLLRQLRRSARCEILFMHAKTLFEDETKRFDAIPHFEVIALENPMDSRTWIPLYSLYEECGAKQKMIAHLEKIIPLIEKDSSLLEKTPFNIESLKNTLSRTRKSVIEAGGFGAADYNHKGDDNPRAIELNDHAARLQRGWVDAIPIVKISAISAEAQPGTVATEDDTASAGQSGLAEIHAFEGSAAQKLDEPPMDYSRQPTKSNNSQSSAPRAELSLVTSARTNPSRELINWRDLALSGTAPKGATKKVTTMAFASELEKHIAVQCMALLSSETSELANWHWQVWRRCDDFQYPTADVARIPKDLKFTQYGGQLHKLIKMVTPVILRANKEKFIADLHLRKIGLQGKPSQVQVDLTHPALKRGPLAVFTQRITASKLKFFDTQGLGQEVFFDLGQRAVYFDGKWQLELPPAILSYRIMEHLLHFQKGVPGIQTLNAETEIVPVIQSIRDVLSSSGISRLRIAFGIDHAEINEQLKTINRDQLISLLGWNSDRTTNDIVTLQQEMRLKTYADLFGITLDLIGISESITGANLCESNNTAKDLSISSHPIIDFLIKLATRLTI